MEIGLGGEVTHLFLQEGLPVSCQKSQVVPCACGLCALGTCLHHSPDQPVLMLCGLVDFSLDHEFLEARGCVFPIPLSLSAAWRLAHTGVRTDVANTMRKYTFEFRRQKRGQAGWGKPGLFWLSKEEALASWRTSPQK